MSEAVEAHKLTPGSMLGFERPEVVVLAPSRLKTDADRRNRPKPEWLVEHVIPAAGIGQTYGETYSGKSFVMLDLALTVANGLPTWHGNAVNRSGPVVYVLMEGAFDFVDRIDAWLSAHPGASAEALFTLEEEDVDLRSWASIERVLDDVAGHELAPALVIFDTQALATPGTDENSNTDMGEVLSNLKRLSVKLGAPVFTVHHTGHDTSRARGASAQRAALDVEIRVSDGSIDVTKVKAYKPSGPYPFVLAPSGPSVWAAPAGDRTLALWEALTVAGTDGLNRREAALATDGDTSDTGLKRAERELKKFVAQDIATVSNTKPARYRAIALPYGQTATDTGGL